MPLLLNMTRHTPSLKTPTPHLKFFEPTASLSNLQQTVSQTAASSLLVHAGGAGVVGWVDMPADPGLHRLAKRACRTAHHLIAPRKAARAGYTFALYPSRDL